jgi:hypothetical protein
MILPPTASYGLDGVEAGLGRIVALHHRPSTLNQNCYHIRCLYF